jgi:hypothetical protein
LLFVLLAMLVFTACSKNNVAEETTTSKSMNALSVAKASNNVNDEMAFSDAINKLDFTTEWQNKAKMLKDKYASSADSVIILCMNNGEKKVSFFKKNGVSTLLKPLKMKLVNGNYVKVEDKKSAETACKTSQSKSFSKADIA